MPFSALFGSSYLGLRALATGLPVAFLANPLRADTCAIDTSKSQFIIMSTSDSGDPMNANMPGTYDFADIAHPPAAMFPDYAMATATLGGKSIKMAKCWADLINSADPKIAIANRIAFVHHSTQNNSHTNQNKVQRLMGALPRQEMLVSYLAKQPPAWAPSSASPSSSVRPALASSCRLKAAPCPNWRHARCATPCCRPPVPDQPQSMRDQDLNRLNALFKETGNTAQKAYLDRLATSQTQVRSISQNLLDNLSSIVNDTAEGQIIAAASLVAMKVAPVVSLHLPFGGDNHTDNNLQNEANQTSASIAPLDAASMPRKTGIAFLMQKLTDLGLRAIRCCSWP